MNIPPATRRVLTVLSLLAAVGATLPWLIDLETGFRYATDLDVYRKGAQAFLAGENLYTQDYVVGKADDIVLPFTYPPLAAMLSIPLAVLPYTVGLVLWTLGSVVLLWWCIGIVLRHAAPLLIDADRRTLATWLLPLALLTESVRETLAFGQINIVLMALVLADTLTRRTRLPRGVLIGFAAAIKLTPAVFILVFLVRRRWRDAAVTFVSGVGFTLLAALLSWGNSWTYWFGTLADTGRIGGEAYASNQSIRGVLTRLAEPGERADSLLWLGLILVALGLIVWAMWRAETMLATVLLASTVALVCSPISWSHHWVWLVPIAITLLAGGYRVLGAVVAAAAFIAPHWTLPHSHGAEHDWAWWAQIIGTSYLVVTLVVVVAATISPRVLAGRR
ncbi:MAG: glycosyltransferase 87 family protein [Corynebacterium sp.]|uniref:glycosyltransferase 87 family protein n=1 Tax=Corynebacterium sp. TaxID=1720 RepID=UPI0026DFAEF7|nr:glycosyltransferase 87 family protein [Corynebacterium sp.]MDO5668806.1 glycosyltransferase 87 family protein [Corynebacterium sp.]